MPLLLQAGNSREVINTVADFHVDMRLIEGPSYRPGPVARPAQQRTGVCRLKPPDHVALAPAICGTSRIEYWLPVAPMVAEALALGPWRRCFIARCMWCAIDRNTSSNTLQRFIDYCRHTAGTDARYRLFTQMG
ncbi:MAG: hypothetical protein GPOALKHO_000317 [Sodalis sp.]|uniref:hypothetical protein n=1 Tax=Sodalis sp. (in: enterobacteria) TaxID=1898979 RepID=UPI0038731151|nr:MAG: hypothetical protein GPOALKHO_000317 [Sodalis sp.]